MSDYQPHDAMRDGFRWFPVVVIIGILASLAVVLTVLSTQRLWFFADTQNAKHQVTIQQISASAYANNPGTQQADIDQMENAITSIDPSSLPATNAADARTACKFFARINPSVLPPGDKTWTDQNCLGSQLAPGSAYNQ